MNDVLGTVVDWRHPDRAGQFSVDDRKYRSNALGHFHGVSSGSAINGHNYCCRWHIVAAHPEAHVDSLVLNGLLNRSQVAQVDRRAAGISDDEVAVLLRTFQLALRAKYCCTRAAVQLARTGIAGAALDRRRKIIDRNPASPHRRWIGFDPNSRLGSKNVHARYTGQNADALAHLCGGVVGKLARRD